MNGDSLASAYAWGGELPVLSATRIRLRALREEDAPALFRIFGDPEVMRFWSSGPQQEVADALALIREIHDLFARRVLYQWGIARLTDDLVLGTCTLHRVEVAHRRAELGFALAREHWGQGYAMEALRRLIAFGFESLGLHRFEADTDPRNRRTLRLLDTLGFQREGYLRERFHVNGEVQDSIFLGLLRKDWSPGVGDSRTPGSRRSALPC